MKNSNPWFVPPNAQAPSEPAAKASSAPSQSFILVAGLEDGEEVEVELDEAVIHEMATKLANQMSELGRGAPTLAVMAAAAALLGRILRTFPKQCRKQKIDDVTRFLLEYSKR
jgi:hypothetical protein